MPLLPQEPCVFPEALFADGPPVADEEQRWWALHTRPRMEKSLARKLAVAGVSFFLPVSPKRWRCRGRLMTSHLPLFPGYLFLRGDRHDEVRARMTNLVANSLFVTDQAQMCDDLARLYRLWVSGEELKPEERVQPGTAVEIVDGPLKGLEGKVLRRGNQSRLFVEVHFLQRGASVEIEDWMIRPIQARSLANCHGR